MMASMGSQALPSSNIQPTQTGYPAALYPPLSAGRGAQAMFYVGASVPASSYYIVPISQQAAAQAGASRPQTSHPLGAQSVSRVSLRPPQQVLNIQTSLPAVTGSQLSPSVAGKKSVASPKVQMMKSALSTKRPAQKEQPSKPQPQPQQFESMRSKFRESLSTALVMDSYQQDKKQSAQNLKSDGSADQKGDEV
ncbi:hypothetical protein ZWY2020_001905 [Hordeum vulgare]|nr:hypothetical protein ZWY2020_001905 [Hordeum vulgare]